MQDLSLQKVAEIFTDLTSMVKFATLFIIVYMVAIIPIILIPSCLLFKMLFISTAICHGFVFQVVPKILSSRLKYHDHLVHYDRCFFFSRHFSLAH